MSTQDRTTDSMIIAARVGLDAGNKELLEVLLAAGPLRTTMIMDINNVDTFLEYFGNVLKDAVKDYRQSKAPSIYIPDNITVDKVNRA